mmetsp:Transcript_7666/g.13860  ORF Transcript_7666/g.13860 Transcript_7666/m.13860 type:complete len:102 (-) Transcript_7666:2261-2566(-)
MEQEKEQRMYEQRLAHRPPGITVFIRTFDDGTIELDGVSPYLTIDEVKIEILEREGLPVQVQKLFFQGKAMDAGWRTLKSYGVDGALGKFEYTFDLHINAC